MLGVQLGPAPGLDASALHGATQNSASFSSIATNITPLPS